VKEDRRTFNFLGLTHICGTNPETGYFVIHRKTMGRRIAAKLKEIKATLRQRLHGSLADTIKWLQSMVRGYFQYHAIPGNEVRLQAFRNDVLRTMDAPASAAQPAEAVGLGNAFRSDSVS